MVWDRSSLYTSGSLLTAMYTLTHTHIEELILRGTRSSSFYFPRNLSNHMDRLACTCDTVLVKSREMTVRSIILLWWLGWRVQMTKSISPVAYTVSLSPQPPHSILRLLTETQILIILCGCFFCQFWDS